MRAYSDVVALSSLSHSRSIDLSVNLSNSLSIYLPTVNLSIYLSIYLLSVPAYLSM